MPRHWCHVNQEKVPIWFRRLILIGSSLLISSVLSAICTLSTHGGQLQESRSTSGSVQSKPSDTKPQPKSPDRIFGVVPAYTITDAVNSPPLTAKEKFNLFAKGTLDPFPMVLYAVQAGISQAHDTHSGYGQGAEGYGKRFGAAFADGTSARFLGTYVFPSLLHQDPRYFRKQEGTGWSRLRYSMSRPLVTRSDSGNAQLNWSNMLGKITAGGLSNIYYPRDDRGVELTLTRVAISLCYQTLGNIAIEFWPDIRRKIGRGKNTNGEVIH